MLSFVSRWSVLGVLSVCAAAALVVIFPSWQSASLHRLPTGLASRQPGPLHTPWDRKQIYAHSRLVNKDGTFSVTLWAHISSGGVLGQFRRLVRRQDGSFGTEEWATNPRAAVFMLAAGDRHPQRAIVSPGYMMSVPSPWTAPVRLNRAFRWIRAHTHQENGHLLNGRFRVIVAIEGRMRQEVMYDPVTGMAWQEREETQDTTGRWALVVEETLLERRLVPLGHEPAGSYQPVLPPDVTW